MSDRWLPWAFTFIGGRPFFILIFERKEIHMELNEMEKKLLFQVEGDYQTKILNELYMTVRYSNNSEQREAAEGLMAKLRVLSNAECMDLVEDIQKNYRLRVQSLRYVSFHILCNTPAELLLPCLHRIPHS